MAVDLQRRRHLRRGLPRRHHGLTTNFAWWASDFIVDIDAADATIAAGGELPAPIVTTQNGEQVTVDGLETIVVSGALDSEGEALVITRLKQELVIDGAFLRRILPLLQPLHRHRDGGVTPPEQPARKAPARTARAFCAHFYIEAC